MRLTLDPLDLKPEFQIRGEHGIDQICNSSEVTFEKLTDPAQAAVRAVGQGLFKAWDGRTYKNILPPKN